jgi:excisionase family DNA binding protein
VPEAIAMFGVAKSTLYRLIRQKKLPAINLGTRLVRIERAAIEQMFPIRQTPLVKKEGQTTKLYSLEPEDCYTIGEISKKYGVSDSSVHKHIRKFSIPTRQIGKYVYDPKSEIDNLIPQMKELSHTKVTVRIRKVEDRKEWYVYLESYPIFVPGKKTPQRIREYINRSVTTVEWDKKRTARTNAEGTKTYKSKRNDNGIIACRSEIDQETMLYADGVRKLRQREYDNAGLYSDTETA